MSAIHDAEIEFGATVIEDIEASVRGLRHKLFADAAVIAASLGVAVSGGASSLLVAAVAAAQGYKSLEEYRLAVNKNPAAFLWRINKAVGRKT